ncbi:MAG: LptF/LptG family permease [Prevotella sp.]
MISLRIKKLDIFITKQFALLFVGTFFICQFVLMMQFLWRYVDELIGKGLSLEIMAQFFWYMGLMLVPKALPLAILLSSLITFGNLGESSELTAIKAAGISLMQSARSLIVLSISIALCSFMFQNVIAPQANIKLAQLLISMKQKSPELEIPQGIFYDGIPGSNIYVSRKDLDTGKLYGVTIYRMTGSYEDQAIILADSAMLQSTADKKHLLLTLWNGEWFENMQSSELGNKATIPYRRETFFHKQILIDYNDDFNMTDASLLSHNAQGKGLSKILHDIDSLNQQQDSIGRQLYADMKSQFYHFIEVDKKYKSAAAAKGVANRKVHADKTENIDSIYNKLPKERRSSAISYAMAQISSGKQEMDFHSLISSDGERNIRLHNMEAIAKFTLSLSCIIFFFIGAPLGAIIRKGGLGLPVIISVLIFIVYYILENSGTRMAKLGVWNLWFGCCLSTTVLSPLAIWVTYKANNDSMVFNIDAYKEVFRRVLAIRINRNIFRKEVIISDPDYRKDAEILQQITEGITEYARIHSLRKLPNPIKVFFRYEPDHRIENISEIMENTIEDLSNTRDKLILAEINHYPILDTKAHTRPFERKWLNIMAAIILPLGLFFYFRMVRFRFRLYRDLVVIKETNRKITERIENTF